MTVDARAAAAAAAAAAAGAAAAYVLWSEERRSRAVSWASSRWAALLAAGRARGSWLGQAGR